MKQEHKQILKDIYDILNPSDFINAVYKTPAQNLRDSANELERREKVENAFREMLEEYGILKETPKSIVSEGLTGLTGTDNTIEINIGNTTVTTTVTTTD